MTDFILAYLILGAAFVYQSAPKVYESSPHRHPGAFVIAAVVMVVIGPVVYVYYFLRALRGRS